MPVHRSTRHRSPGTGRFGGVLRSSMSRVCSMYSPAFFPLNKALWTSSFVLVTGGLGTLVYAAIYYIADILDHNDWGKPAIIFGSNAITVYFLSSFTAKIFGRVKLPSGQSLHGYLYEILESIITIPKLSSLIYAILIILFYYFIALVLYRKKIFIKV